MCSSSLLCLVGLSVQLHASACTGYIKESRKPVTDDLFRVVKQLRAEHAVARGGSALQIVAGARIPIIRVRASTCSSDTSDICQQCLSLSKLILRQKAR